MKIINLAILAILLPNSSWTIPEYENYSYSSFYQREDVNQTIDKDNFDSSLLEAALFYATNEARNDKKKSVFKFHPVLLKSSQIHSQQMEKHDFFDHTNKKNRRLRKLEQRIEKAGGGFSEFGENIAKVNIYNLGKKGTYFVNKEGEIVNKQGKPLTIKTYKELAIYVVDKWMHSKGHRENILRDYSFLACGISNLISSKDGIPEVYITQNFGKK
jgi:uncharacterized protein YkwD